MAEAIYGYLSIRLAYLFKNILKFTLLKYLISLVIGFFIFSFCFLTLFWLFFAFSDRICLCSFDWFISLSLFSKRLDVWLLLSIDQYWQIHYCVLFLHRNIVSKEITIRFIYWFGINCLVDAFLLLINSFQFWLSIISSWFSLS